MGNDLFVGGLFVQAGSVDAYYLARWNDEIDFYSAPKITLSLNRAPDGNITVNGSVPGNTQIILEVSVDLVNWSWLQANFGNFVYSANKDVPKLFFRCGSVQP
jgi:hypothetical protein